MTPRLQFLTLDAAPLSHPAQARAALRGGVRWIQVRAKGRTEDEWVALARTVVALCREHGATCVINDSPRVARLAGADGVHLGPEDATPAEARRELGEAAIVGATLNFPAHLARLREERLHRCPDDLLRDTRNVGGEIGHVGLGGGGLLLAPLGLAL